MKISTLIILLVFIFSCNFSPSLEKACNNTWKSNGGWEPSGCINFSKEKDAYFYLDKKCNIFLEGKYIGKILKVSNDDMTIISTKGEEGYYTSI